MWHGLEDRPQRVGQVPLAVGLAPAASGTAAQERPLHAPDARLVGGFAPGTAGTVPVAIGFGHGGLCPAAEEAAGKLPGSMGGTG